MYTLIDGIQFYDKDEVDNLLAQNGSTGLSDRIDQEAVDRATADDGLGARIDQETIDRTDGDKELADKLTQESNIRLLGDQTLANQLTAIEQLWSTLISANFIDTDSNTIMSDDSGKSIRQIAHDEFYRQLVTDADGVKQQLDTLKELADYLQNNPTILTDIYTKLGITWSLDTPTDFGVFDFSGVLAATDIDSAIVELYNMLVNKAGDLSQLTTAFKGNIVGAINELDAEIGNLSTLNTVEKGTIVGAINSEFEWRRKNDETLGTRIDNEVTDRAKADLILDDRIGLLNSLKTTDKSSTVAAINEIYDTVQQNGGGGSATPTPIPSDNIAIISISLQSNVTGSGQYTETVDLTDLAECVASNKPYLFEVAVQLPIGKYTFRNCPFTIIKGEYSSAFNVHVLHDLIAADAANLAFTLNHADAINTSVTLTLDDSIAIGGGGSTGTDTTQLESKLNAEITARTQADADLNARIDADIGDLSTLTTTNKSSVVSAINEVNALAGAGGGGTVLPSDNSNVCMLQLTSNVEIRPGVHDTITLTPEQVSLLSNAVDDNVPIIAVVTNGDLSASLIELYRDNSNGCNIVLVGTLVLLQGDKTDITSIQLVIRLDSSEATFTMSNKLLLDSNSANGSGNTATNCEQFTFVIDSDESLSEWANNDRSKGQDYTSVLIKKGEWHCTIPEKGTVDNKGDVINVAYIDILAVGTQYIYGESGSKLILESPYTVPVYTVGQSMYMVYGLAGYNIADGTGVTADDIAMLRRFRMCNVNIECTGESHYFAGCVMLFNLFNCNVDMVSGGGYPISTVGYEQCYNITCCSGSAICDARSEGDTEANAGGVAVTSDCYSVSKCYPSRRCKRMKDGVEITGVEGSTDTVMVRSYASWSNNNDYMCDDTPAGGFNNTTNPSV